MRSSAAIAFAVLIGGAGGALIGTHLPRATPAPVAAAGSATASGRPAAVLHGAIAGEHLRADMYLPRAQARAPWMIFAHERRWPPPDEGERVLASVAESMQRRGIGVAAISFLVPDGASTTRTTEGVANAVRDLMSRAEPWGLDAEPVLAGADAGAALIARIALDARYGVDTTKVRGVIGLNGVYDDDADDGDAAAPTRKVRRDAPPFLVLSSHGEPPRAAQSTRTFARALEAAGAKIVRSYHVGSRDARTLTNLSGERNDVGDLVAAFVRGEPAPGGPESPWSIADTWGAAAPLSSEPFWKEGALVQRRPVDQTFRAQVRRVFGDTMNDLDPWPSSTYDAIDLATYLRAHPELGSGGFVEITNARSERLVLSKADIERDRPVIVVGLDDEKNLFRLLVTYNVLKTYSWKPETEPRPLLARPLGAFLHFPSDAETKPARVTTMADFALTTKSFRVVVEDPWGSLRSLPGPLASALTDAQGCAQCHSFRGSGARAHHLRASDGKATAAFALPFEEYPRDVLRRFLFEQKDVARSFGVNPLVVSEKVATLLFDTVAP